MWLKCCFWAAVVVVVSGDWVEVSVIKPDVKTNVNTSPTKWVKPVLNTTVNPSMHNNSPTESNIANPSIHNSSQVQSNKSMSESNSDFQIHAAEHSTHTTIFNLSSENFDNDGIDKYLEALKTESYASVLTPVSVLSGVQMADVPFLNEEHQLEPPQLPIDAFQNVHKMLLMEKRTNVTTKIEFLQNLQNSMLEQIERRMKDLWADKRQARTGKMGFPSMESALLSISFLVFAVFLIKLVQQLFQSFGSQNTNTAMIVPPQQGTQPLTVGRRKRSLDDVNTTARILQLMDEFPMKYKCQRS